MKIVLLHLSFFLTVCAAQEPITVLEGEDFRNSFSFTVPSGQTQIYLCRLPCQPEDMLMQVHGRRTKSGRYNLRLDGQVHVAITQVIKQDAGDYRVGLTSATSEDHRDFQLKIKELCDGGVKRDEKYEYWVSPGSDLTVPCKLRLALRNRKFLCREDCKAFLIDTNDEKGYSPRYGLEYVSPDSFNVTFKKLRASDVGRYRCGVGRESSNNYCQEFTIRMNGIDLIDPNNGNPDEGHETVLPTVPNLTEETGVTGVVLPIVVGLLVGIIIALVILLIHLRKKIQSGRYVNGNANTSTKPGRRPTPAASNDSGVPTYASLRPETRESEYSALALQPMQGQTNTAYLQVY